MPSSIYSIPLRNHWWFDVGIIGLYLIGKDVKDQYPDIDMSISSDNQSLEISYHHEEELRSFLSDCYEELARRHWNVSTKKQKEAMELFIYDAEKDEFYLHPKRQQTPIPELFVKASKPKSIPIKKLRKENPRLAERAEQFAKRHNKKFFGKENKLLFEPPVTHTKIDILPSKKGKHICSVCSRKSKCKDVSQPAFLLFASKNATLTFNSEIGKARKICWECNLLGRFAVETALYKKIGNKVYILQIYTPHLQKLYDLQGKLGVQSHIRELDEDFFSTNMDKKDGLINLTTRPYELLWAYYYTVFSWYLDYGQIPDQNNPFNEMLGIILDKAPIQVYLLDITKRNNGGFSTDKFLIYDDSAYMFRLMYALREKSVDLKSFFFDLLDRTSEKTENQTLYREQILRCVLEKRSIILQIEKFAFHISRNNNVPNLKHILDFTVHYESLMSMTELERMGRMNQEQIKKAVNLGTQIVMNARDNLIAKKEEDSLKKIKGDLYALRKTRTSADFLNQINTFQMRYGIIVSKELLNGMIEEVDFDHFKAYVVTSALNTFNRLIFSSNNKEGEVKNGEQTA